MARGERKVLLRIEECLGKSQNSVHLYDLEKYKRFIERGNPVPPDMMKRLNIIFNETGLEIKDKKYSKYFLYAISDGDIVKVGYSSEVNTRLKTLQTGNPKKLKLVWSYYCGQTVKDASREEYLLHKRLKKYHVRGEWFDIKCLPIIKNYYIRSKDLKESKKADDINGKLDSEFFTRFADYS